MMRGRTCACVRACAVAWRGVCAAPVGLDLLVWGRPVPRCLRLFASLFLPHSRARLLRWYMQTGEGATRVARRACVCAIRRAIRGGWERKGDEGAVLRCCSTQEEKKERGQDKGRVDEHTGFVCVFNRGNGVRQRAWALRESPLAFARRCQERRRTRRGCSVAVDREGNRSVQRGKEEGGDSSS
ncbi:hypothetical protein FA10DRAFT_192227 [Acaromyces ingoldii]|uniref:Uncharacterized protein n=1 Tax=Acaromyces ingoldii TaxID=215250 RepID=A0A316YEG7_9BASI|nr:hypothetical protein FA10DRAFT_192227 [Acaromyces ingoldii]PWN87028.1 hypothetical protein FA10DRAFT_192227 [Acaromyces ingoldii]